MTCGNEADGGRYFAARRRFGVSAYVYPPAFVVLLVPMRTTTSTAPAAWAGATTVSVTASTICTFVPAVPPKVTDGARALVNPAPVMVTTFPPAGTPLEGETAVMAGAGTV